MGFLSKNSHVLHFFIYFFLFTTVAVEVTTDKCRDRAVQHLALLGAFIAEWLNASL